MPITTSGTQITFNDATVQTTAPIGGIRSQLFTSSGTFTVPAGVTALKVTLAGGGGGGGGGQRGGFNGGTGNTGGATSFGGIQQNGATGGLGNG